MRGWQRDWGQNELPNGWVWTTVGEIYDIVGGGTPSTNVEEYWKGDTDWVTSADIYGLKDIRPRKLITKAAIENSATNLVPEGSLIVVTRVGLGKVALTKIPICFSQDSQALIGDCSSIYPDYSLYYLAQAVQVFKYQNRGTTIAGVTKKQLSELPFFLPPLAEQHRIVSAIEQQFTRLDAGVAALRQAQAKLKRYRAAVLKAAVDGKLIEAWRAEHPTTEPASMLLDRILKERHAKWEADLKAKGKDPQKVKYVEPAKPDLEGLPELPEGWCWARAEQLCDFITKGTTPIAEKLYSGTGVLPFIKVYNLTDQGLLDFSIKPTFISVQTHSQELARSMVFPGDVLMNIVGPPLGKVSIVPNLYPEWNINQAITFFRPIAGFHRKFLCFSLLTDQILFWAESRAKATAGQSNLTLEICRDLPLPLPPFQEQEQIVAEVEQRLSVITQLEAIVEANLKRAERLRQSILKEAFAGRLVPQDPNDEPASVLLERIRKEREGQKKGIVGNGRYVDVSSVPVKIDVEGTRQVELWEGVGG